MEAEFLSVKEVSVRLGCHEQTVRGLIRDGRLVAVRVGKLVRVSVEDLGAFARRNRYRSVVVAVERRVR